MSDGPPPPPPPPEPQAEETDTYVAYLEREELPSDGAHEDPSLRLGDWRFCYRGPTGSRSESVALHPDGAVVRSDAPSEWWALLSEPSLDARQALRRVAWLLGRPAPIGASFAIDDPDAAAMVTDPTLDADGDSVTLRGWVVWPPNMQSPFLIEVAARRGSPSSPTWTRWNQAPDG